MNAYWFQHVNFGDQLTPFIFSQLGIGLNLTSPNEAKFVGAGSILNKLSSDFSGSIFGTGFIKEHFKLSLHNANVFAARGRLSKERISGLNSEITLGDFGILTAHYFNPNVTVKHIKLGVIPHYIDKNVEIIRKLSNYENCMIIDVERPPECVIKDIVACQYIVSSSLHGLVIADSFNIPNYWIELSKNVIGNGFKFYDYYSAFGEVCSPLRPNSDITPEQLIQRCRSRGKKFEKCRLELNNKFLNCLDYLAYSPKVKGW